VCRVMPTLAPSLPGTMALVDLPFDVLLVVVEYVASARDYGACCAAMRLSPTKALVAKMHQKRASEVFAALEILVAQHRMRRFQRDPTDTVLFQELVRTTPACLTSLNLSGRPLGSHGCRLLSQLLATVPTLHDLNLCDCELVGLPVYNVCDPERDYDDGAFLELAAAIGRAERLESIDLSENCLCGEPDPHFPAGPYTDVPTSAVAAALRANTTLTTLVYVERGLQPSGARILAEALLDNRSLTTLRLQDDNEQTLHVKRLRGESGDEEVVMPVGVNEFLIACVLVACNQRARKICIRHSMHFESGARGIETAGTAFVAMLRACEALDELQLRGFALRGRERAAALVADGVLASRSLRILDVSGTGLRSGPSTSALAHALEHSPTLTRVDLSSNEIGFVESASRHGIGFCLGVQSHARPRPLHDPADGAPDADKRRLRRRGETSTHGATTDGFAEITRAALARTSEQALSIDLRHNTKPPSGWRYSDEERALMDAAARRATRPTLCVPPRPPRGTFLRWLPPSLLWGRRRQQASPCAVEIIIDAVPTASARL